MELNLRVQPVSWTPASARAFDPGIAPGDITLGLREIDWQPLPRISASVQFLEGEDAEREFAYCIAGGAP